MVITVTLNPALDRTIYLEGIHLDDVNRVISYRTDIGGKGINVSKVLSAMGTPSKALGFIGENHKERFEMDLDKKGIMYQFTAIKGDTRTNIKMVDTKNRTFTDLNEKGPVISPQELSDFMQLFSEQVGKDDIVVLSGGLSEGIPVEIYAMLTKTAKDKGAAVVSDAKGMSLIHAVNAKPCMLKPNEREFSDFLGRDKLSEEEIILEAAKLVHGGIEKVLISRGDKGSILVTKDHHLIAEAQEVIVKSTVGAGDAMVAALVKARMEGLSDMETLVLAQAASTASVMTEGTEVPGREEILGLRDAARGRIREAAEEIR